MSPGYSERGTDSLLFRYFAYLLMIATLFVSIAIPVCARQAATPTTAPQMPPSQQSPSTTNRSMPSSVPSVAPPLHPPELRFVVILDPAHGGVDNGAMLVDTAEKEYTLALAGRLHVLLYGRGIRSSFTRENDITVDNTTRAVTANRAHAAACILLHATDTGNGVHLFTSSLPAAEKQMSLDARRSFLPWQTAQASYSTESLRLESDINAAMAGQHIPVLLDRTSLMPLNSLACPAVVIEVAPLNAETPLTDAAYKEKIAQALAVALISWRSDWRLQP